MCTLGIYPILLLRIDKGGQRISRICFYRGYVNTSIHVYKLSPFLRAEFRALLSARCMHRGHILYYFLPSDLRFANSCDSLQLTSRK